MTWLIAVIWFVLAFITYGLINGIRADEAKNNFYQKTAIIFLLLAAPVTFVILMLAIIKKEIPARFKFW